jgi:FkbM family methyltransferase
MSNIDGDNNDVKDVPYITYAYNHFAIALPANHLLPTYQKQHRLYDRFLPHLAKYIDRGSIIIDVGANCGDSLASMYDVNQELNYVCIEADDIFFEFLNLNVSQIRAFDPRASILTIKSFIGKNVTNAILEGSAGTKHAVPGSGSQGMSTQTLDAIFANTSTAKIRLLKSDVDGYDYDVIESARSLIERHSPLIFFECQFDHEFQKTNYLSTIAGLESMGYADWAMFDNFGQLLLRANSVSQVIQLFEYVWRQNINQSTRTIYYFDVLASTRTDTLLIDRVLKDYASV